MVSKIEKIYYFEGERYEFVKSDDNMQIFINEYKDVLLICDMNDNIILFAKVRDKSFILDHAK